MTTLLTRRQIVDQFVLTPTEMAYVDRIRAVQIAGARHGKAGYYPDGDYSSDADWCNGIGAEIQALESALDIDDGAIGDLYSNAHEAFFRDGTINPSERDTYSSNSCFTFRFGAYGDTVVSLWAQADHLEDALELAAEWLAKHAPGHFVDADALEDCRRDACEEAGVDYEAFANGQLGLDDPELWDCVEQNAMADLTHTGSGYLASYEWFVDESDVPPIAHTRSRFSHQKETTTP